VSPAGGQAPTPREWIGGQPFPWPPVTSFPDGEPVTACFSVAGFSIGRTRSDAAFLKLSLTDCFGTVEARMWDDVESVVDHIRNGIYIGVRGCMETYQNQRQIRVDSLAPLSVELDDLVLFMPRSARSADLMDAELAATIATVEDDALRHLLETLLAPDTETGQAFRLAPAAKQNHHAYLGGLIEHTLSVTRVCDLLAAHYGSSIDRDLVIAAALLHDLGKIREIGARSGFPYTDEGKLLGHIIIGMQVVADAARQLPHLAETRLLLLQHLIASHQGRYEWHSPREPRTLEAMLLHYADDLDAKFNQALSLVDAVPGGWSAYDRGFGRDFLRHRHQESAPAAHAASSQDEAPVDPTPHEQSHVPALDDEDAVPRRSAAGGGGAEPGSAEAVPAEDEPRPAQPAAGADALSTLDLFE
jgi:3'-5' exoribonuclease